MITIRAGTAADRVRIDNFYESQQRGRGVQDGDFLLLAEERGEVVAAVRLCPEAGYLVLRGMYIEKARRGQGLGRRMLIQLEEHLLHQQDCYCLPWKHLEAFYGIIGFRVVSNSDLPTFLQDRLAKTRRNLEDPHIQRRMQDDLGMYPDDGLKLIGMLRPAE